MSENTNYQKLKAFFQEKFPEANESILRLVAQNRLKGLGQQEELDEINPITAESLINFFQTLSPEELQSLSFNALASVV